MRDARRRSGKLKEREKREAAYDDVGFAKLRMIMQLNRMAQAYLAGKQFK